MICDACEEEIKKLIREQFIVCIRGAQVIEYTVTTTGDWEYHALTYTDGCKLTVAIKKEV